MSLAVRLIGALHVLSKLLVRHFPGLSHGKRKRPFELCKLLPRLSDRSTLEITFTDFGPFASVPSLDQWSVKVYDRIADDGVKIRNAVNSMMHTCVVSVNLRKLKI